MKRGPRRDAEEAESKPGSRPSALQENVQAIITAALSNVVDEFKKIHAELARLSKRVEQFGIELLELEGKTSTLDAIDKLTEDFSGFKAKLPELVDGIMAAQFATPMTAVLKLPKFDAGEPAAARGGGHGSGKRPAKASPRPPRAEKPKADKTKAGWKLKPCPTAGCKGKLCAVDRYKPGEHYECKKCGHGKPGAKPAAAVSAAGAAAAT